MAIFNRFNEGPADARASYVQAPPHHSAEQPAGTTRLPEGYPVTDDIRAILIAAIDEYLARFRFPVKPAPPPEATETRPVAGGAA